MTYQDVVLGLEEFFAKKGCVIQEPYDIEVGAGTSNPATFPSASGDRRSARCQPARGRIAPVS